MTALDAPRYRRLSIVITASPGFAPLPFAAPLAEEMGRQLLRFGYRDSGAVIDVPAKKLAVELEEFLDTCRANDIALIHVISHGVVELEKLRVVGVDGVHAPSTEVERWLTEVEGAPERPTTLFVLDLCYAGVVTRLGWQGNVPDERRRSWVIAASEHDGPAYDGRLSRATATVLRRIADREVDIATDRECVPAQLLGQEIRREVNRISDPSYPQRVVGTRIDLAAEEWFPFVPNPLFRPAAARATRVGATVDEALQPFLDDVDDVLDWRHFVSRAGGTDFEAGTGRFGGFRGRRRQLRQLVRWLEKPAPKGGLLLVTGSPGVGKSALIGIVVCATHAALAEIFEPLWRDRRDELPPVDPAMAAVHARQHRLDQVVASIGRQLELPDTVRNPDDLLAKIGRLPERPVVVVDALDEALDPPELMADLLIPLARVCRVVVGARPWAAFDPLRDLAGRKGSVIDLDRARAAEVREAVAGYVTDLLRRQYPTAVQRPVLRTIANTVATTLTASRTADGGERWGEFIVAGVFAHHLSRRPPLTDVEVAAATAAAVPRTLPEVLELDLLGADIDHPWLRPVLTAVAYGFGSGMPRTLIAAAAPAFTPQAGPAAEDDVAEMLDLGRFYLRQDVDRDGTVLYRLFHQGLIDYLRPATATGTEQDREAEVLRRLLEHLSRHDDEPRLWSLAEPYLLRHAVDHAVAAGKLTELITDAGFLVHADPETLVLSLIGLSTDDGRAAALVYQASYDQHAGQDPPIRRSILLVNSCQLGAKPLLTALAEIPDLPGLVWRPRWVSATRQLRRLLLGHVGEVVSVVMAELDGRPVALTGGLDGTVRVWDLRTGACLPVTADVHSPIFDLVPARIGGHQVVLIGSNDGITVSDLTFDGDPRRFAEQDDTCTLAAAELTDGCVAVGTTENGTVRVWDVLTGALSSTWTIERDGLGDLAIAELAGRPVVLTEGADGAAEVRDLPTGDLLNRYPEHGNFSRVVIAQVDDSTVAVTGHLDEVHVWNLRTGETLNVFPNHDHGVGALAVGTYQGRPVAISSSLDALRVWEFPAGAMIHTIDELGGEINAAAIGEVDQRLVGVTGHSDGTARVWDLNSPEGTRISGHDGQVFVVATGVVDGNPIVVSGSEDRTVRVWDQDSGAILQVLPHENVVEQLAVGAAGERHVAVARSGFHSLTIWDLRTGEAIRSMVEDDRVIYDFAICEQDGRPVLLTAFDGAIEVLDFETGTLLRTLETPGWNPTAMSTTEHDGRTTALLGSIRGQVRTCDLDTGSMTQLSDGDINDVRVIVTERLGDSLVALAAGDHGVAIVSDPLGHSTVEYIDGRAVTTAFVNGRTIAAVADWDGNIEILDLATLQTLDVITVDDMVRDVAFGTDGSLVVAYGREVAVFDIRTP